MDDSMGFPEPLLVIKQAVIELITLDFLLFNIGKDSKVKDEQHDTSREDISCVGILNLLFFYFRSSISGSSFASKLLIGGDIAEIKVAELQSVVTSHQEVVSLDVQVSHIIVVKIFETLNELVEVTSGKLLVPEEADLAVNFAEITIRGVFHQ